MGVDGHVNVQFGSPQRNIGWAGVVKRDRHCSGHRVYIAHWQPPPPATIL